MSIEVVAWSPDWAEEFDALADLPAKPIPDVRNHLAARDVLRWRDDLRDAYGAVKRALADDPTTNIDTYLAGKSSVLQEALRDSGAFSDAELLSIHRLNDPSA